MTPQSSIVYGGTSALFQSTAKSLSQKYEHNFTSAKLEILFDGNFLETICWEISWKPYAGKFLETICWEFFLKLYAGNYVLGNSGGCQRFFEG